MSTQQLSTEERAELLETALVAGKDFGYGQKLEHLKLCMLNDWQPVTTDPLSEYIFSLVQSEPGIRDIADHLQYSATQLQRAADQLKKLIPNK